MNNTSISSNSGRASDTRTRSPVRSANELSVELEELCSMRLKVQKAQLQAHIARISHQLKLAKMIDRVYQEAEIEEKHDIRPREHKEEGNSLEAFFKLQSSRSKYEGEYHNNNPACDAPAPATSFTYEKFSARRRLSVEIVNYSKR